MYAAHAPLVSAIRADYHASARARANRDDAATVDAAIVDADRTTQSTCRFEESAVANLNGDDDDDEDEDDKDDDDDDDHDDDVVTVGSVSSRASIDVVLTNLSARMWDTPSLRPTQEAAIAEIMHGRCGGKLLLVHRTGGGKSHILRMTGSIVAGVVVVIVPLLTLCADQMRKIKEASQKYASCEAQHIDECSKDDIRNVIIPRMNAIGNESSSVMFIFVSPQKLVSCGSMRAAILRCHQRKTLRLVVIDEAHLYAMHGRSFRGDLRLLQKSFFEVVFRSGGAYHPLFLLLTATMTRQLLPHLSKLTNVDWSSSERQLWSSAQEFQRRYITVKLKVVDNMCTSGSPDLIEFLQQDKAGCAFVFVNFVGETSKWTEKIERSMDAAHIDAHVLAINGQMHKHEKFAFIRLFTGDIAMSGLNCRVVVGTSCVNTGIDQHNVRLVQRAGIPRCILNSIQEGGRNARKDGMTGKFILYAEWTSFIKLLLSILLPHKKNVKKCESDGVNSVIQSKTPDGKRRRSEKACDQLTSQRNAVVLSNNTQRENVVDAYNNLMDSVSLYCLPGHGCIHVRTEWFQCHGELKLPPNDAPSCTTAPCLTQCYVCNGDYSKYFLPVVQDGAISFLKSRRFLDAFDFGVTVDSCDGLLETLYKCKDSLVKVFGKATVAKYQVAGFFLSLIGSKILIFEWQGSGVNCVIARDSDDNCYFENPIAWAGFTTRKRVCRRAGTTTITAHNDTSIGD
jgi:superfamily II DNA helicase RecQ